MRPKERRESGQTDLFRARLDQIVDPSHALVKLARAIDWSFFEARLGEVYDDDPGRPPLASRLMAGLAILKHLPRDADAFASRAPRGMHRRRYKRLSEEAAVKEGVFWTRKPRPGR
jgi:hypothetical protein